MKDQMMIKLLAAVSLFSFIGHNILYGSSYDITDQICNRKSINTYTTISNDSSDRQSFQSKNKKLIKDVFEYLNDSNDSLLENVKFGFKEDYDEIESFCPLKLIQGKYEKTFGAQPKKLYILAKVSEVREDPNGLCFIAFFKEAYSEKLLSERKKSKKLTLPSLDKKIDHLYREAQEYYEQSCRKSSQQARERLYWLLEKGGLGLLPNKERAKSFFFSEMEYKNEKNVYIEWLKTCNVNYEELDSLISSAIEKANSSEQEPSTKKLNPKRNTSIVNGVTLTLVSWNNERETREKPNLKSPRSIGSLFKRPLKVRRRSSSVPLIQESIITETEDVIKTDNKFDGFFSARNHPNTKKLP